MILGILFGALVVGVTVAFAVILGRPQRQRRREIDTEVTEFGLQLNYCNDVIGALEKEGR